MPPSGFSKDTTKHFLGFLRGNYQDLLAEVRSGKYPNAEAAMEYEIEQIGKAMEKMHINDNGELIERS